MKRAKSISSQYSSETMLYRDQSAATGVSQKSKELAKILQTDISESLHNGVVTKTNKKYEKQLRELTLKNRVLTAQLHREHTLYQEKEKKLQEFEKQLKENMQKVKTELRLKVKETSDMNNLLRQLDERSCSQRNSESQLKNQLRVCKTQIKFFITTLATVFDKIYSSSSNQHHHQTTPQPAKDFATRNAAIKQQPHTPNSTDIITLIKDRLTQSHQYLSGIDDLSNCINQTLSFIKSPSTTPDFKKLTCLGLSTTDEGSEFITMPTGGTDDNSYESPVKTVKKPMRKGVARITSHDLNARQEQAGGGGGFGLHVYDVEYGGDGQQQQQFGYRQDTFAGSGSMKGTSRFNEVHHGGVGNEIYIRHCDGGGVARLEQDDLKSGEICETSNPILITDGDYGYGSMAHPQGEVHENSTLPLDNSLQLVEEVTKPGSVRGGTSVGAGDSGKSSKKRILASGEVDMKFWEEEEGDIFDEPNMSEIKNVEYEFQDEAHRELPGSGLMGHVDGLHSHFGRLERDHHQRLRSEPVLENAQKIHDQDARGTERAGYCCGTKQVQDNEVKMLDMKDFADSDQKLASLDRRLDRLMEEVSGLDQEGSPMKRQSANPRPQAVALFNFPGQKAGDLTFEKGEIVTIIKHNDRAAWWVGRIRNREGPFPSNYVQLLWGVIKLKEEMLIWV